MTDLANFWSMAMNYPDTKYALPTSHSREVFAVLRRSAHGCHILPKGLVVTPDYNIRGHLGEALLLCGVTPIFAANIHDAAYHLATSCISFIVCEQRLPDGFYTELLSLSRAAATPAPLVVISPTGDWPDYFEAIDRGAYDFLAYPLIPGELQRIVTSYLKMQFNSSSPQLQGLD